MSNNKKLTGVELQKFMNTHGISPREFAEIFGVTQQAVMRWLNDEREFSLTNSRVVRLFQKYPTTIREFAS